MAALIVITFLVYSLKWWEGPLAPPSPPKKKSGAYLFYLCCSLCHFTDIYSNSVETLSVENIQLFERLKNTIEQEMEYQFELEKLSGCLQTIVRSNAQTLHRNALKNQELN